MAQATDGATVGRPHIADALVARGLAPDRSAAFAGILHWRGGYYQPHYAPDPLTGVRLIREAGGVPVLAHPGTGGRGRVIPEQRLARLVDAGLFGLEIDHRENTARRQAAPARARGEVRPRDHRIERLPRHGKAQPAGREHHRSRRPRPDHRRSDRRGALLRVLRSALSLDRGKRTGGERVRRSNWSVGAASVVLVAALVAAGGAAPARAATSYPSWGDVQAAKSSAAASQAEVDRDQRTARRAADGRERRGRPRGQARGRVRAGRRRRWLRRPQKADDLAARGERGRDARRPSLRTQSGTLASQLYPIGGDRALAAALPHGQQRDRIVDAAVPAGHDVEAHRAGERRCSPQASAQKNLAHP